MIEFRDGVSVRENQEEMTNEELNKILSEVFGIRLEKPLAINEIINRNKEAKEEREAQQKREEEEAKKAEEEKKKSEEKARIKALKEKLKKDQDERANYITNLLRLNRKWITYNRGSNDNFKSSWINYFPNCHNGFRKRLLSIDVRFPSINAKQAIGNIVNMIRKQD